MREEWLGVSEQRHGTLRCSSMKGLTELAPADQSWATHYVGCGVARGLEVRVPCSESPGVWSATLPQSGLMTSSAQSGP